MRVITGLSKGRKLKAPKGMGTRPTTDRAKEALFNIIGGQVREAKFLDLFAGTGAIGIEALSRGAREAVFVESNPQVVKIIKENLALTGFGGQAEVLSREVDRAVDLLSAAGQNYNIIFMDPPYLKNLAQTSLVKVSNGGLVAAGGLVITESSKLDLLPEEAGHLKLFRQEKYGDTVFSFYQES